MKKILVPIDFSPASHNAFKYAVGMGVDMNAEVLLLHAYSRVIVEPYMPASLQKAVIEQQEEIALEHFEKWASNIDPALREAITIDFQIVLGPVIEEILINSEKVKPDLIIMGMRGGNHLIPKILGNTVTGVIQRSLFPVLAIPENVQFNPIQNIAYATNFEHEDIRAIDEVLDFAQPYQAKIHCIHIQKNGNPGNTYIRDILKRAYQFDLTMHNLCFETINYPDVVEGLNQYVDEKQIDLLVMLTHHRGIFNQLFHSSHTKRMVLQTHVPLWIFQMKRPVNV